MNCWKSTNGGQSWNINTHWYGANGATYMHADEHMLKYNPLNNFIYSGNDGGQEVPHFHIHILGGEKIGSKIR